MNKLPLDIQFQCMKQATRIYVTCVPEFDSRNLSVFVHSSRSPVWFWTSPSLVSSGPYCCLTIGV